MIDFNTIQVGDKVKVVGAGAPGYAQMGEVLEVTKVLPDRVYTQRLDNQAEAFFALTCGAARLEKVQP